ncbi:MAG: tol-pal system protein YbgF [Hyphomicrobiales bacterium]
MRSFKPFGLAVAVHLAVAAGLGSASAVAQSSSQWDSLYDRIIRLEHRLRSVEANGGGYQTEAVAGDPAASAQMSLRLDRLESDLRTLLGQVQELAHQVKQLNKRLKQSRSDRSGNNNRTTTSTAGTQTADAQTATEGYTLPNYGDLSTLGQYPEDADTDDVRETVGDLNQAPGPQVLGTIPQTAAEGQGETLGAVPDPVEAKPLDGASDGPDALYENSYNDMLRRRFGAAEQGFRTFLKKHGKHELAGNAQYWLGETYYARGRYKQAAKAFLEGYRKYKKSPKAPDSLLKLGMSLKQLGQKQHACKTFAQVKRQFPKASANVKNLATKEHRRTGCKA